MIPYDPNIPSKDSPNFLIRLYDLFRQIAKDVNGLLTHAVTKNTSGNIEITGEEIRILGDFSNATHKNRLSIQTNIVDGATSPFIIPNGAGNISSIVCCNNSDPSNSSYTQVRTSSTESQIISGKLGTGSYLPFYFNVAGINAISADTSGNVISNVNTTPPTLSTNQQMVFALTSNTNLRISVRGTDGTTRVANITIA